MNYGLIDTKGEGINGGICSSNDGDHNRVTVFVEVTDLAATLQKAVELGGEIIQPITVVPNMVTFALFSDVEGNIIGLTKSENEK